MAAFVLNGKNISVEDSGISLLKYLRGVECLKGTKEGCSTGHCGACTVLVDGKPRRSCITKLSSVEGKSVLTIEGLEDHTIQQTFLDMGAVQCGFCTPGMVLATKALLDNKHVPTRDEIKRALSANYCRCTGYVKILKAVEEAGRRLYPEEWKDEERPHLEDVSYVKEGEECRHYLGKHAEDMDGRAKVEGSFAFADDLSLPNMLYGRPLFARVPRARINFIDTTEAVRMPGVVRVFTAKDVPGLNGFGMVNPDWPLFVDKEVFFYGSVLALVVAETEEEAEDALKAIKVDMTPLEAVTTMEEALEKNQILKEIDYKYNDIEPYRVEKDLLVLKRHFDTTWVEHAYLEPESVLAYLEGEQLVVACPTQAPFEHRKQLSKVLAMDEEDVRVKVTPLGGGFGGKGDLTIQPMAAVAAKALEKPVKITLRREESLFLSTKKHPCSMDYEVGFDRNGYLRYIDVDIVSDGGAHSALSPRVIDQSCIFALGPYRIPAGKVRGRCVRTNNVNSSAMRGFGINQVSFAMETIVDEASLLLGLDPFEIRRRNSLRVGDETFTGEKLFYSVGAVACLNECEKKLKEVVKKYEGLYPRDGKRLGIGVATCFKNVGAGKGRVDNAGARILRKKDGSYLLYVSGVDMGQGFRTAMRTLVAETLSVPLEAIEVVNGDTGTTMVHGSAVGERQTLVGGMAVKTASDMMKERLLSAKDGEEVEVSYFHIAPRTFSLGDEEGRRSVPPEEYKNYPAYTYCTQAAVLEVEEKTGKAKVLEVVVTNDVGRALNPTVVEGQMEGSVSMGLGYALSEHYQMADGYPLSKDYGSLGVPKSTSVPLYHMVFVEDPEPNGPYGAKGMSEIGTVPMTAAVTNAIHNAVGARIYRVPATPEYIKSLMVLS